MSAVDAVVVAAGASTRAGVDKLGALVAGRPLLAWTLAAVAAAPEVRSIVVVAARDRVAELAAAPWMPPTVAAVVAGGVRRQESVAAGVGALPTGEPGDVVLVHDGARPLASPALFGQVAAAAARHGAAIPVVPVVETLKRVDGERVAGTVDRAGLVAAQTPQGVRRDVLARAWGQRPPGGAATWTDEAALLEACRIPVHVVPGEAMNLKVTLPGDLARVEAALAGAGLAPAGPGAPPAVPAVSAPPVPAAPRSAATAAIEAGPTPPAAPAAGLRAGLGEDAHPFGPGSPLALGGLVFSAAPRLQGHSDGDVVLHALCDALLGAAGQGDLGGLFPAGPGTPVGIAGRELVAGCLRRARDAGYEPVSVDLTVVGARPRLAARLPEMASAIAALLGIDRERVNVKASTGNLAGFEGAGRGIAARAIVLVAPCDGGSAGQPEGTP